VCSKCTKAGLPHEHCHGHRANQISFCPTLQAATTTHSENNRKQLDPQLQTIADECLPVTPANGKSVSFKSMLQSERVQSPDEIMSDLAEGLINAKAAKMLLLSNMSRVELADRSLIQTYIDNVDGLAPVAKQSTFQHPSLLQSKGKLSKLFIQCVSNVMEQLHKSGKPELQQKPTYDLSTGKLTIEAKADVPIQSVAIFNAVLEQFRHIVVTRDHLSESELHSLLAWVHHQLALGKKLIIVERSVKRILQLMDEDHGRDLNKIIRKDARSILDDQTDIHTSSFQRTAPTATEAEKKAAAKTKAAARKPAATDDDDVTITLKQPNAVSCWYDTNGLRCANKIKDASGECKYKHLHGTCGMPLSGGGYCMEQHKAAEHK
jgi:hypothetical protein